MNIPEEIQKLQELHRTGALTDAEFTAAKSAVLAGLTNPPPVPLAAPPPPAPVAGEGPWVCLGALFIPAVIAGIAFYTNPDQASLEAACRRNQAENRAKAGLFEKVAGDLLLDVSVERKNYYLLSIGTVTSKVRLGGPELAKADVIGCFGHWWFEFFGANSMVLK